MPWHDITRVVATVNHVVALAELGRNYDTAKMRPAGAKSFSARAASLRV